MAIAQVHLVPPKPPKPVRIILLTLSEDEASTLLDVTHRVGGDPRKSRRRHTDAIGEALWSATVTRPDDSLLGGGVSYADGD